VAKKTTKASAVISPKMARRTAKAIDRLEALVKLLEKLKDGDPDSDVEQLHMLLELITQEIDDAFSPMYEAIAHANPGKWL
jgi:hypothetical protein